MKGGTDPSASTEFQKPKRRISAASVLIIRRASKEKVAILPYEELTIEINGQELPDPREPRAFREGKRPQGPASFNSKKMIARLTSFASPRQAPADSEDVLSNSASLQDIFSPRGVFSTNENSRTSGTRSASETRRDIKKSPRKSFIKQFRSSLERKSTSGSISSATNGDQDLVLAKAGQDSEEENSLCQEKYFASPVASEVIYAESQGSTRPETPRDGDRLITRPENPRDGEKVITRPETPRDGDRWSTKERHRETTEGLQRSREARELSKPRAIALSTPRSAPRGICLPSENVASFSSLPKSVSQSPERMSRAETTHYLSRSLDHNGCQSTNIADGTYRENWACRRSGQDRTCFATSDAEDAREEDRSQPLEEEAVAAPIEMKQTAAQLERSVAADQLARKVAAAQLIDLIHEKGGVAMKDSRNPSNGSQSYNPVREERSGGDECTSNEVHVNDGSSTYVESEETADQPTRERFGGLLLMSSMIDLL